MAVTLGQPAAFVVVVCGFLLSAVVTIDTKPTTTILPMVTMVVISPFLFFMNYLSLIKR
jgi:hypothetical protein